MSEVTVSAGPGSIWALSWGDDDLHDTRSTPVITLSVDYR